MSLVLGAGMIVCLWTLFFMFHDDLTHFLTKNAGIDTAASTICDIYLVFLPFDFVQMIIGGYIRGIGQEVPGFMCFAISFYGLGLPTAFVLGNVMHYYDVGLFLGMGVGIISVFTGFMIILYRTDLDKQIEEILDRVENHTRELTNSIPGTPQKDRKSFASFSAVVSDLDNSKNTEY